VRDVGCLLENKLTGTIRLSHATMDDISIQIFEFLDDLFTAGQIDCRMELVDQASSDTHEEALCRVSRGNQYVCLFSSRRYDLCLDACSRQSPELP
jgi:hypothetical protein